MLKTLRYLEIPSNKSFTSDGLSTLKKCIRDLDCQPSQQNPHAKSSFHTLIAEVLKGNVDFFFWDAEDWPETFPESLDFFFIPEINTALVFKSGNKDLQIIRNFFCPPVIFVGGGPGNHEWMTIEAKIILDHCDIVFYDALVNPLIVASLHEDVERYYVGKRGDSKSFNQEELNNLIALYSRRGYKVGRLKGGDPGILGRITEEIDTLNSYGLSYQIVPGISAMQALSASAGIFLTQRGICDRVTLTTARSAGGKINNLLPFNEASLIVYMGILSAESIKEQLLGAGYSPDLPTAILTNLTRSGQKVIHSTLGQFAKVIKQQSLRPPGLLVFGKTAAKDLQRIPAYTPLSGRKVLLCNDSDESLRAARKIRRWGGKPVFLYNSLLSIDGKNIMPEYDDVIFFSPREVSNFYELLEGPKISAECNIVSSGEEVDAAFKCLFRRSTIIIDTHKKCVEALREKLLAEYLK